MTKELFDLCTGYLQYFNEIRIKAKFCEDGPISSRYRALSHARALLERLVMPKDPKEPLERVVTMAEVEHELAFVQGILLATGDFTEEELREHWKTKQVTKKVAA